MPKRKCWVCGADATVFPPVYYRLKYEDFNRERQQRGYCESCASKVVHDLEEKKQAYIKLRKELMFERAIKSLEHQKIDIYEYKDAIEAVQEFNLDNLDRFDSAPEMIAAIVLVQNRIDVNVQKKIGKYTVDFQIPGMKVILEVDGERHGRKLYYDNERDKELRRILGYEWEVVRIKTEYLEENAKELINAIKAIRNEKQKLRAENNGFLPDWYSKREFAKKPKEAQYGDELLIG